MKHINTAYNSVCLLACLSLLMGCSLTCSNYYSFEVINDTNAIIAPVYVHDKNFPLHLKSLESWRSGGSICPSECKIPSKFEVRWESMGNKYSKRIELRDYLNNKQRKQVNHIAFLIKPKGKLEVRFLLGTGNSEWYIPKETAQEKNLRTLKQELRNAIGLNNEEYAIKLINKGTPVNPQSILDPFPTDLAVLHNQKRLLRHLLQNGALIEFGHDSALSSAVLRDNIEMVTTLVQSGAKINYDRNSSLNTAIEMKRLIIAKYLIDHGAEVDKEVFGQTPMANAIRTKDTNTVKLLLENGVDPNAEWNNQTYLEFAKSHYGTPEIITMMKKWHHKKR